MFVASAGDLTTPRKLHAIASKLQRLRRAPPDGRRVEYPSSGKGSAAARELLSVASDILCCLVSDAGIYRFSLTAMRCSHV